VSAGVSLPVTRPAATVGRALVVANPSGRAPLVALLARMGFDCGECDDPYSAALELAQRRLVYRALILSLAGLFREELSLIATVKRRYPHIEIWLAHTDGRQASLAESMRLGADGLIDDEGLHRIAATSPSPAHETSGYHVMPPMMTPATSPGAPVEPASAEEASDGEAEESRQKSAAEIGTIDEPVLTADELRALLQDQPSMPPSSSAAEKEG
jgi:hypothetical protein